MDNGFFLIPFSDDGGDADMRRRRYTADSRGADLTGADLTDADLSGKDYTRARLTGANLVVADLTGADLTDVDLADACLTDATLDHMPPADLARRYRELRPAVPVVDRLDAQILDAITTGGGKLDMADWHTCATTHCRAGWAVVLAGDAGRDLEARCGTERAATMIYRASTGRVPCFFADDADALADIERAAR